MIVKNKRHIAKSITWRVLGSIDTILISYLLYGNIVTSLSISSIEIITKTIMYFFHEKIWYQSSVSDSRIRHLIKPFTWRFLATLDTIVISAILFNDIKIGAQLGLIEIFSKILLYYIHDKIWYKFKFGLK